MFSSEVTHIFEGGVRSWSGNFAVGHGFGSWKGRGTVCDLGESFFAVTEI